MNSEKAQLYQITKININYQHIYELGKPAENPVQKIALLDKTSPKFELTYANGTIKIIYAQTVEITYNRDSYY